MTASTCIFATLVIGIVATLFMDLWSALLRCLGIATLDFAMLGRWAGHLFQGQWRHESIGRARAVRHERAWGWAIHYAVGVAFAAVLLGVQGSRWLDSPTLAAALTLGLVTALVPLCVMQPAMGAGFFAARTPTPTRNCLRSVMTHGVFGLGLYMGALAVGRGI